jgi:hypothetical protein
MKTKLLLFLVLLFAGCSNTPTAPQSLPSTPEYAFYTDALVNEMWFVLLGNPDQEALLRVNVGERLTQPIWTQFNKQLELYGATVGIRQALQARAITLTLSKYNK